MNGSFGLDKSEGKDFYDKEDDNDDEKKKQMTATDDKDEIEGVVEDSDIAQCSCWMNTYHLN